MSKCWKVFMLCGIVILSSCTLESQVNWAKSSIVEKYDTFKGILQLCTKEYINRYTLCYFENNENKHVYVISGSYFFGDPVPISFNEAIDKSGKKLKIESEDDRRLGATINEFTIWLDDEYIDNLSGDIDIRMYGKYQTDLHIPYIDVLALKEKVSEINH